MRAKIRYRIIARCIVASGLLLAGISVDATEEFTKVEEVSCTVCHDKPGSKLLTDKGKYWEEMRSFEGYEEIVGAFQQCTSCHVRKPGAKKLTPFGRRISRVVDEMEDLKEWLQTGHPPSLPPEEGEATTEDKEEPLVEGDEPPVTPSPSSEVER